jgi:predicted enzyme related to lactoylglutathione lyase
MINGIHALVYAKDAVKARAFFRDVLGLKSVDAGEGWLIFAMPPAELGVHPAEGDEGHGLYLMCDDVKAEIAALKKKGVKCDPIMEAGWGSVTSISIPGGAKLGLYQPHHPTAISMKAARKPVAARKPAPKVKKTARR